jgi:predicted CoA-binding protein
MKTGGTTMEETVLKALKGTRVIAVVGLSDKPDRPSYQVARYLQENGYRIIPVNPMISEVLGQKSYPDLTSIPERVDMVDVFRKSEDVPPIAEQAVNTAPKYFWMQEGIENEEAKESLESKNITVIMDRCIKKEHARYIEKL